MLKPKEFTHPDAFSLPKLIYCLGILILLGYYVCSLVIAHLLNRTNVASLVPALDYSNLALFGFPLASGIIVCLLYTPVGMIFSPLQSKRDDQATWYRSLLYGVGGGLFVFVLSIPFLIRLDMGSEFVAGAMAHIVSVNGLPTLLLLIVALPIVMEATFRGTVFRTLAIHADLPSAVLASGLIFAFVWPTFSRPVGVLLGMVSPLLYLRTNNLLASILANAVVTLSGGAFVLYRALLRH